MYKNIKTKNVSIYNRNINKGFLISSINFNTQFLNFEKKRIIFYKYLSLIFDNNNITQRIYKCKRN